MNRSTLWLLVLLAVIVVRLGSLSAYPLHDTTEARYSEIARIMASTDEWLVPQIAPGTAFWAKPPLSIWATAASIKALGPSELPARLPASLFALASMMMIVLYCRRRYALDVGLCAGTIFLSSGIGFVGAGAVMTDAALTLAVTVSALAFAAHLQHKSWISAYGFFVGLALGLLAKGPVAAVLIAIPVGVWSLWRKDLRWLWHFLPWLKGSVVVCALALPWYVAAERSSPGFIEYFLVGEHFHRFLDSGWSGDLYGNAHDRPRGTIWLYGLVGLLPWSVLAVYAAALRLRDPRREAKTSDATSLLVLMALSPLLLFTFAGNILPAYVMPSLPAFSILLGRWLAERTRALATAGLVVPAVVVALIFTGVVREFDHKSQKGVLGKLMADRPSHPVYYFGRMPYSASFYSAGSTVLIRDEHALGALLSRGEPGTLLVRSKEEFTLSADLRDCMTMRGLEDAYTVFEMGSCAARGSEVIVAGAPLANRQFQRAPQ